MLVDTSGLLCLIHDGESEHFDAVRYYAEARSYLIHSYILDEFVSLTNARKLPRIQCLAFSRRILTDASVDIVWVDQELHASALTLLEARTDKSYSLCDAVSFVLMHQHGISDALTTDRHFEQEGFVRLLK